MNKATVCLLFIGSLIIGIALYGMNTVSANQTNTNPAVFQNTDVIPARPTAASEAGQEDLNNQNQNNRSDLKNNQAQAGSSASVSDLPPKQQTKNIKPPTPVNAPPASAIDPGTTGGKTGYTSTGNPEQQKPVNNAPQVYYGCWDQDGCD